MTSEGRQGNMPPELDSYDWAEAFGYAGEPGTNGSPNIERTVDAEDAAVAVTPFTRADVTEIVAMSEGENDGPPWIIVGRLHDGRWFHIEAGCDYTGWDCQAGGTTVVSGDRERLIRLGVTAEHRERLGLGGSGREGR